MGINSLNSFLEKTNTLIYYDNINEYINNLKQNNYSNFNTKQNHFYLGIDLMLYAHKFHYSCGNIYIGFLNQILTLLSKKIIPIYIMDGKSPVEKNNTKLSRTNKLIKIKNRINFLQKELELLNNDKNKINNELNKLNKINFNLNNNSIKKLIELLNIFNIPFLRAKGEADVLIANLYKKNIINACLSEDMDLLAFGCKKIIKFKSNKIIEYNLDYILNNLNLNLEEFIELCILFGCDYCKSYIKLPKYDIYKKLKNNSNYIDIIKNNTNENVNIHKYLQKFINTKKLFIHSYKNENIPFMRIKLNKIDINKINTFINNNCNLYNNNKLQNLIPYINDLISNNML